MKKFVKKFMVALIAITMVMAGSISAFAASPVAATAPKVMINDKNVVFHDAIPQNVKGRIMVPFSAMLESLGAKVDYDQANKTVTAVSDDTTISFVIGKSDVQIKKGDKTSTIKMDVIPYVDPKTNRTYVSSRFMAESLGYSVGYDGKVKSVVIVDFEKLFANADKDFSVIGTLLKSNVDMTKTYKQAADFKADINVNSPSASTDSAVKSENMNFSMSGNMTAMQQEMNMDMIMAMNLDLFKMLPMMTDKEKIELQPMLDMAKDIKINIKMDGKTGMTYVNSPLFTKLGGLADNTWVKLDVFSMYKDMGLDFEKLMTIAGSGNMSMHDMLLMMANSASSSYTVDTYKDVTDMYSAAKSVIGDSSFEKTTAGNVDTYTLKPNASIKELGLTKANLALKVQNGNLVSYTTNIEATEEGITMGMDIAGDMMTSKITMKMDMPSTMSITMLMNSKVEESTGPVVVTPPAGAKIIDINDLLKSEKLKEKK